MKNCKLCRYSRLCNELPGICVLIPHVTVVVVAVAMAYLFITQELMQVADPHYQAVAPESEAAVGNRLTKIYTRTGDDGSTGLADGSRVPKDHQRIEVLGCLDELNSVIGLIMVEAEPDVPPQLAHIQNRIFDLGAELARPGAERTSTDDVAYLETALDGYNSDLPPLREFILPGGGGAATLCHLARALCRRTERRLVSLAREEQLNPQTLRYINRLSDLLFVLARVLTRRDGGTEVFWQPVKTE